MKRYCQVFVDTVESDAQFARAVTALLAILAGMGLPYVAVCDFEDRLPGDGRSPGALWPTGGIALSAATRRRLARAGWSQDRSVDVDPVIQEWAANRYPVNQLAVDFLRSFGFLELRYTHARVPTSPDGCHFDAIRATRNISPETVRWWGERVGAPLVPIGEAFTAHVTLVMAADGAVYGGYDPYLWKIGARGEDAIEALCSGREPLLLPEPDDQPPG